MTTARALLRDYDTTRLAVADRAGLELLSAWGAIETFHDVALVREAITPTYLALVARFGGAQSALAALVGEELFGTAPAPAPLGPTLAAADVSVRVALGSLYGQPRPDDALTRLDASLTRHVLNPGRDTLLRSGADAGVRWRRAVRGADPCDWCLMLAGRGAVFHSAATAGDMNRWHDGCACAVEPDL